MPYKVKNKCVYKKDTGKKVGCTSGSVKKYLAALHANVNDVKSEIINEGPNKFLQAKKSLKQVLPYLSRHFYNPNDSFYLINDYGYGDCGSDGPYTLLDAIKMWNKLYPDNPVGAWDIFEPGMHYIATSNEANRIEQRCRDFMSESSTFAGDVNEGVVKAKIELEVENECNCGAGCELDSSAHHNNCPALQILKKYNLIDEYSAFAGDVNIDDTHFNDIKNNSVNPLQGDCDDLKNDDGSWKNEYQMTELKKIIKQIIVEMNTPLFPTPKNINNDELNTDYSGVRKPLTTDDYLTLDTPFKPVVQTDTTCLSEIAKSILKEENQSVVVKNLKAEVEDIDSFMNKPENTGEVFNQNELESIDGLESKPDKKETNKIKYSSVDELSGRNKDLTIIKKQGHYVGFYSLAEPVDIAGEEMPEDEQNDKKKSVVIIKISKPFAGKQDDVGVLSNFISELVGEYQIK